eukprot:TRINITY_DN30844_c0_g2_i1.p1 TRINITY_DN30844_c0_g2~~TRINITY_DN30844_c0_g2_i1.p1  ORF type:complete len:470 (-),score=67.94 TRINITY_DN30844_c0_g2_i1:70-1479(-)
MLPQVAARNWFHNYDAFRSVPKDLSEASSIGALMTIVAVFTCITLFFCETNAFLSSTSSTRIVIDSNQDESLKINFDITMLDMACEFCTVGVWDAFGTERMNVTKNIQKQRIDHKGDRKGSAYTEDELTELEYSDKVFTDEELAELDSDWGSTSDNFKHDSFSSVVEAHEFTFINFYADWCPHCRQFAPTWGEFEKKINDQTIPVLDADGNQVKIRALKLNCVDFEETCQEQEIRGFPTLRLYRRGAKPKDWAEFHNGQRDEAGMSTWLQSEVGKRHLHAGAKYHDQFSESCRITGTIEVARIPGTLHVQAQNTKEKTFNPAFTNVSHTVHHFTFGEAPRGLIVNLPSQYKKHVNPLDGRTFVSDKFHKAPNHFIKVVHTRFSESGLRSYQQTHQWSLRTLSRSVVPQAKFSYDLAPVEVVVSKGDRRWYDYLTQVLAITGGTFTVMSMLAGFLKASQVQVKSMLGKYN